MLPKGDSMKINYVVIQFCIAENRHYKNDHMNVDYVKQYVLTRK